MPSPDLPLPTSPEDATPRPDDLDAEPTEATGDEPTDAESSPESEETTAETDEPTAVLRRAEPSESRREDSTLVASALAGNQLAFRRLMRKYTGAIHHLVFRMISDKQEVEDLVQEAFVKAFNALASFNDEYAFSTWLYKIATNHCIDHLRRRKLPTFSLDKPIQTREGEMEVEVADPDGKAPDEVLVAGEQTAILQSAVTALPEKYRRVIVMRHQEEKTYEEIAEELDLPLGTVKAHIFRAREALYKSLRDRRQQFQF